MQSTDSQNDNRVVASTQMDSFLTTLKAAGHDLLADEPLEAGGSGMGPSPYDLLGAALASCTSMTLKMYAGHKGIALKSAIVEVSHSKIHAQDCVDCETQSGKIDEFVRTIKLDGGLTDAEVARMLEIADRCPVHKTLHSEVSIRTVLA